MNNVNTNLEGHTKKIDKTACLELIQLERFLVAWAAIRDARPVDRGWGDENTFQLGFQFHEANNNKFKTTTKNDLK